MFKEFLTKNSTVIQPTTKVMARDIGIKERALIDEKCNISSQMALQCNRITAMATLMYWVWVLLCITNSNNERKRLYVYISPPLPPNRRNAILKVKCTDIIRITNIINIVMQ